MKGAILAPEIETSSSEHNDQRCANRQRDPHRSGRNGSGACLSCSPAWLDGYGMQAARDLGSILGGAGAVMKNRDIAAARDLHDERLYAICSN